jgi:hypothetical protein
LRDGANRQLAEAEINCAWAAPARRIADHFHLGSKISFRFTQRNLTVPSCAGPAQSGKQGSLGDNRVFNSLRLISGASKVEVSNTFLRSFPGVGHSLKGCAAFLRFLPSDPTAAERWGLFDGFRSRD